MYSILSHKFTNTLTIHQNELEVEKRRIKFSILSHDNTRGKFLLSIGPYSPTSQIWNIKPDKPNHRRPKGQLSRWVGKGVTTLGLTHAKFITSSVSWPISAPELCCMIIATTAEETTQV